MSGLWRKQGSIMSRLDHLVLLFVVIASLMSFNYAQMTLDIVLTPRDYVDPTQVDGYVCGIDTTDDSDRMAAEKNSAFIFDLLGSTRTNPLMGREYHTIIFDVASYDDDLAENVNFSLPNIGSHDVVALFLVPSNAQCNQLTFKDAANQSDLYLPVYFGSSAIPEDVIARYQGLESGIKNHFGMKWPKLCGAKMFMGHPDVATSRSEAITSLFNFAFITKRQPQIDTKTSCATKDDTVESLQKSEKIDTTTSFAFLMSEKSVDDTKVCLRSIVTRKEAGKISVIYVDPVFEAPPKQISAGPADIVDHSWPVVFNKTSKRTSSFFLIKADDDGNEFMKLTFRPLGKTRKKRMNNNNNNNYQVVGINSNAPGQLNYAPAPAQLKVITIPVGQGDSTVIMCPNGDISIIDMGCLGGCTMNAQKYTQQIVNNFFPNNDYSKLKHIFFTHPDADHINFALQRARNGNINGGFLYNIRLKQTPTMIHFGEQAGWQDKIWFTNFFIQHQTAYGVIFHGRQGHEHPYDDIDIDICGTNEWFSKIIASDIGTGPNERSMVMSLQMQTNQDRQKKMLFLGDFQGVAEYDILLRHYGDLIEGHQVLMVPHHGADTHGNGDDGFFQKVFQDIEHGHAIVSSAIWSAHNHPKGDVLIAVCDKPQNEFMDQTHDGGVNGNANRYTIMGWFKRFKQGNPSDTYPQYSENIAFSYECGDHNLYQTTKVDFATSEKLAFTYKTSFTNNPQGTTVVSYEAQMDANLVLDPNTHENSYSGNIF